MAALVQYNANAVSDGNCACIIGSSCPSFQVDSACQSGDSLMLSLSIDLADYRLASRASLELIPSLVYGNHRYDCPAVILKGKKAYREHQRALCLNPENGSGEYCVLRSDGKTDRVEYHYAAEFQSWMKDAVIELRAQYYGCNGNEVSVLGSSLSDLQVKLDRSRWSHDFLLPYRIPETEYEKNREKSGEAHLQFIVDRIDILPEYGENASELAAVEELIEGVKEERGVSINKIAIVGYASPEGTLQHNEELSLGRARSLKNYISSRYVLDDSVFELNFAGENWEGLEKLVEASNLLRKEEILDIIRNVPVLAGREKQLMDIDGGVVYRHMLDVMFPSLRKAVVKVEYTVAPFSPEEAREEYLSAPHNLSYEELFRAALLPDTIPEERTRMLKTAAVIFPSDGCASTNAAVEALLIGDTLHAERYLETASESPETLNAMAVLLCWKGEFEEAVKLFAAAADAGLEAAKINLENIN